MQNVGRTSQEVVDLFKNMIDRRRDMVGGGNLSVVRGWNMVVVHRGLFVRFPDLVGVQNLPVGQRGDLVARQNSSVVHVREPAVQVPASVVHIEKLVGEGKRSVDQVGRCSGKIAMRADDISGHAASLSPSAGEPPALTVIVDRHSIHGPSRSVVVPFKAKRKRAPGEGARLERNQG